MENLLGDEAIPQWRLDSVIASIGTIEGDEAQQLHEVRGALLRGSNIVVLNGGSSEVRFFDRSGRHVKSIGRRGEGPGEFRSGYWLGPHDGDSIAVYDFGLRRLTVFDVEGNFGRVSRVGYRGGQIAGRLADGRLVIRPALLSGRPEDAKAGIVRDPMPILLGSVDEERLDTLATYPGQELERQITGPAGSERVNLRIRPFGLSTQVAGSDTLIYAGAGQSWEIDVLDTNGRLVRSIRRRVERPLVTTEVLARHRAARLASATSDDARRARERALEAAPFPERLPPYGPLRVDDLGHLWVQDYRIVVGDSLRWTIFDREGRIIGRIAMPPNVTIYQSGADFVLAATQDELDVEYVVLYSLMRSSIR